jgi:hypothetical protein
MGWGWVIKQAHKQSYARNICIAKRKQTFLNAHQNFKCTSLRHGTENLAE